MRKTASGCLFSFCTRANYDPPEATPLTPSRGRGCKYSSREIIIPARSVGSSLVFRSKSKRFEDKIKQNPLKHRFRGFFICCRSVSFRAYWGLLVKIVHKKAQALY
jgi:hypothetical protein